MNYEAPLTPQEREEIISRLTELIGANSQEEVIDEALIALHQQKNNRGALLRILTKIQDE